MPVSLTLAINRLCAHPGASGTYSHHRAKYDSDGPHCNWHHAYGATSERHPTPAVQPWLLVSIFCSNLLSCAAEALALLAASSSCLTFPASTYRVLSANGEYAQGDSSAAILSGPCSGASLAACTHAPLPMRL